jgi:AcrR family transcriptional regulator
MSRHLTSRRSYDSSHRHQQAEVTRRHILEAALRLFERDGYVATPVAAIAKEAGVSVRTVYLGFENKRGLIRAAWHLVLRGEGDDTPVGQQPWFREVVHEPDPVRKLRLNARNSRVVKERAGGLMKVLQGAAETDPQIDELWQRIQTEFHANQRSIVELLETSGALRAGLDVDGATDIMWALNHPSLYQLLVGDRGWTPARYEQWLGDTFCVQLLAAPLRSAESP